MAKSPFKPVRKAVFPVAGMGTRVLPATKVMPKEMLILGDRPLLQHGVEEALNAGIEEIIFVSSRGKGILEEHFAHNHALEDMLRKRGKEDRIANLKSSNLQDGQLAVTYQDEPLGLGHAIWCAHQLVGDEPFAVLLPDDVVLGQKGCLSQMIEAYNDLGGNIVAVEDVPRENTNKYGVLDVESDDGHLAVVKGMVEKPKPEDAPSTLSVIGRYILQPEIFEHLGKFEKGAGGEIQLTDSMVHLIGTQPFHGLRFDGKRCDCGNALGLFEANIEYFLRDEKDSATVRRLIESKLQNTGKAA